MIHYRNYNNLDESLLLNDLEKTTFLTNANYPKESYQHITENFLSVVEKHAPLKKKIVRGNQAPFVLREFRKTIYTRSRLRNKYWKTQHQKMNFGTNNKEINVFLLEKTA